MAFLRLEFRNAGVDGLVGCAKKLVGLCHQIDRQAHQCWDLVAPTGGFLIQLNVGGVGVHACPVPWSVRVTFCLFHFLSKA